MFPNSNSTQEHEEADSNIAVDVDEDEYDAPILFPACPPLPPSRSHVVECSHNQDTTPTVHPVEQPAIMRLHPNSRADEMLMLVNIQRDMHLLMERVRNIEKDVYSISTTMLKCRQGVVEKGVSPPLGENSEALIQMANEKIASKQNALVVDRGKDREDVMVGVGKDSQDSVKDVLANTWGKRPNLTMSTLNTNPKKKVKRIGIKYDPTHVIEESFSLFKRYRDWIDSPSTGDDHVKLDTGSFKKNFFMELEKPDERLSEYHMNAACRLMLKRQRSHPDVFLHTFTTLNTTFMRYFTRDLWNVSQDDSQGMKYYDWLDDEIIRSYVIFDAFPWANVDTIYAPYKIFEKHWVLLCIKLKERKLLIYDSLLTKCHLDYLSELIEPFVSMLPYLLDYVGIADEADDWLVERGNEVPLERGRGEDSGMFTIKFLEYLCTGTPFDTLTQENMSKFRTQLAIDLWSDAESHP